MSESKLRVTKLKVQPWCYMPTYGWVRLVAFSGGQDEIGEDGEPYKAPLIPLVNTPDGVAAADPIYLLILPTDRADTPRCHLHDAVFDYPSK